MAEPRLHADSEATSPHRAGGSRREQHLVLYYGGWSVPARRGRERVGVDPRPRASPGYPRRNRSRSGRSAGSLPVRPREHACRVAYRRDMTMVAHTPFYSPSFHRVAKGLLALHWLIKDGKDDSPEADAVRDALDTPLKALNRIEKERAQWLSEDLYSVSEPPQAATLKEMNSQAQQQLNEALEARQRREWDQARRAAPSLPGEHLACIAELHPRFHLAGGRSSRCCGSLLRARFGVIT